METQKIQPETDAHQVVERGQRLSRSRLWELQRDFFTRQGVMAWRHRLPSS